MCHAWEYELIRKAYAEGMQRRRQREEADKSQVGPASPPRPAEPQPRVRDKEPVPA